MYGQSTNEAFLVLIELDHDDLGVPLRFTSDGVDTISNGDTYTAYPFEIVLPSNTEEGISQGRITIDNIDQSLITAIRSISSEPMDVSMSIVLASDPDTIEVIFTGFRFTNITYNALVISGEITIEFFLNEPFPGDTFLPSTFPGLF